MQNEKPVCHTIWSLLENSSTIRRIVIFCLGSLVGLWFTGGIPVAVEIQMQTHESGALQFFYSTGGGYSERQSKKVPLSSESESVSYRVLLGNADIYELRIDPLRSPGEFKVSCFEVAYLVWSRRWCNDSVAQILKPYRNVHVESSAEGLLGQSTGVDPSLRTDSLDFLGEWRAIALTLAAVAGGLLLLPFAPALRRHNRSKIVNFVRRVFSNPKYALLLILLLAAILRVNYWSQSSLSSDPEGLAYVWPDEVAYFSAAEAIIEQGLHDFMLSERSIEVIPGNPVYIAFMYSTFESIAAIRGFNLVLSILSILFIFKIGSLAFNANTGLLAAFLLSVHGQLIKYSVSILTEPLFIFLLVLGIYYLVLSLQSPDFSRRQYGRYAFVAGLSLGSAVLTRSIISFLPIFLLGAIGVLDVIRSRSLKFSMLRRAILPLLVPLLVVGAVGVKNQLLFGRFMMAAGGGASLYIGALAETEGDEPPYYGYRYNEVGMDEVLGGAGIFSVEGDKRLFDAAWEKIRQHPFAYAGWNIKKVGRLLVGSNLAWFHPLGNFADWYADPGSSMTSIVLKLFNISLAACLAVFGTMGLVCMVLRDPTGLVLAVVLTYFVLLSIPFLAIQRYGLPAVFFLSVPAAAVMLNARARDKARRIPAYVAAPVAVLVVAGILLAPGI